MRRRLLDGIRLSLRTRLLPGELVQGLFAVYRMRRTVTALVVTDLRLLTLGDQSVGMPIVDEVHRRDVTEVHIEREKIFSTGVVTADTATGPVNLGTLDYNDDTMRCLADVLARSEESVMPVIPTPCGPVAEPVPDDTAYSAQHPLIAQLTALADLHERGALTDEEFSAAKARLLTDRPD